MNLDFAAIAPTIIVTLVGFLVNRSLRQLDSTVAQFSSKLDELDKRQDRQERRQSVLQAILKEKGVLSHEVP